MEKIVACRVIGGMVRTSMTGFAETGSIGIIIFPGRHCRKMMTTASAIMRAFLI
ncbi:hypothetical protein CEV34_4015 [Brucella pseudogrignonensis]|uniref:Uncharacterized protein n=1 Tax=Brucella pseudogrignonensis TaxID=419475 RepID=A0A256G854_9HYPH|nr:hypothetical protein CEV34_4015 [Brucella pseudogrignonensis]